MGFPGDAPSLMRLDPASENEPVNETECRSDSFLYPTKESK